MHERSRRQDAAVEIEATRVILYPGQSYKIVGAAIRVWKHFGHGLSEKVYENSLKVELKNSGFAIEQQKPYKVVHGGECVGCYEADLVVDELILLALKTVQHFWDEHTAQVLNHLKVSQLRPGLLLNFGPNGLEHRRVVL